MKITSKTLISMRSTANAVLVAGAITGTSQGGLSTAAQADAKGLNSTPYRSVSSVNLNEEAKDPEKKEEQKEPEKDPCPPCGRG